MDWQKLFSGSYEWFIAGGLRLVLIVVLAWIAIKTTRTLSRRIIGAFKVRTEDLEYQKKMDTLGSVVRHVLISLILLMAALMVLRELGVEIGPILAGAGVLGLAVGFGAQHLVQDVISGFFILFEDQLRVGDVVEIAGKSGLVERVNLRLTILRDLAGNVHYVRNGQIDVVTNMTKEYSRYVFDIGVAYREDVDEVIKVITEVDAGMRADPAFSDDILEPMEVLGLDQFADSAVVVKTRTKTRPLKQWRVAREFNRRLKRAFDERNIEIPYPHVTIYAGQDKQGEAAPLRVSLAEHRTVPQARSGTGG